MSLSEAATLAREVALQYAASHGMQGGILKVGPENLRNEKRGKIPVYWSVVFETVLDGASFDGPAVLILNLETKDVVPFESL